MNPAFPQPSIGASHLLSGFAVAPPADLPDVRRLCVDSRELGEGDVFVALRGYAADGRRYLREASRPVLRLHSSMRPCPKHHSGLLPCPA